MKTDPRGGYNQHKFNKDFFKTWSPAMAYVFGFIMADGAVEDVRKSSRTCYLLISNNDKDILDQIKMVMESNHEIYIRPERWQLFKQKRYWCKQSFHLRIGSKEIYQDLIDLGARPRKSLIMKLPEIPDMFFSFFLRGYFDGDGCITLEKNKNNLKKHLKVIFTSGSIVFLENLRSIFLKRFGLINKVTVGQTAYQLIFRKMASLEILNLMYTDLDQAPYLKCKYQKYQEYLNFRKF